MLVIPGIYITMCSTPKDLVNSYLVFKIQLRVVKMWAILSKIFNICFNWKGTKNDKIEKNYLTFWASVFLLQTP